MNDLLNFLSNNERYRENDEHAQYFHLTSMTGGKYWIWNVELPRFYDLLSKAYLESKGASSLKCLCENISNSESFNLFLDIEDTTERVRFDDRLISALIIKTLEVIGEISDEVYTFGKAYVARNNAFYDAKLHIVFPDIVVNKQILTHIIARLKQRFYGDVGNCIDAQAINGLRIIGAKKRIDDDEESIFEARKKKGWYIPYGVYSEGKLEAITKSESFKPSMFSNFSIFNTRHRHVMPIRKTSLFYMCVLDENVITENPPNSFIKDYIGTISEEDWTRLVLSLPKDFCGKNSYWRWVNLGKFIHTIGLVDGLEVWRKVSYNEVYSKEQTDNSTEKMWDIFEDAEEVDILEMKMSMFNVLKRRIPNLVDEVFSQKLADYPKRKREYLKTLKAYNEKLAEECFNDYYEDKTTIVSHERYVDPIIFNTRVKYCFVSAPLGAGKTSAIISFIRENWDETKPIVWISPRKTFTADLIRKVKSIGFRTYDENPKGGMLYHSRIIVQYESLNRLLVEAYKGCLFISDEIESVFTQMVSKTNREKDELNASVFALLTQASEKVIFADAFLSNRVKHACFSIEPNLEYQRFDYKSTIIRPLVVYESTRRWDKNQKKSIITTAESKWFGMLRGQLEHKKRIYLFVSSRRWATDLFQTFSDEGYKAILYTSETEGDTNNVNETWKHMDIIITTTKITIGIDCQIEFDNAFAYLSAGILTRDAIQSLYRVRNLKGTTYIYFDNRARGIRSSVCLKTIYSTLTKSVNQTHKIIQDWDVEAMYRTKFNLDFEELRYRIQISSIQERAFNVSAQEQYGKFLFESQGYNIIQERLEFIEEVERTIDIKTYNEVPVISQDDFNRLIEKQKKGKLSDVEKAELKKHVLLKYVDTDLITGEAIDRFWTDVLDQDYRLSDIKAIYELERYEKDYFLQTAHASLLIEGSRIAKKDVFDKVRDWFSSNGLRLQSNTVITKEQIESLYLQTKNMDAMRLNIAPFNEHTKEKYKVDRINAFFSNVIPGLKLKAGTPESIAKEKETGKRQRSRKMVDGTQVYTTPYTLIRSKEVCDYEILRK